MGRTEFQTKVPKLDVLEKTEKGYSWSIVRLQGKAWEDHAGL